MESPLVIHRLLQDISQTLSKSSLDEFYVEPLHCFFIYKLLDPSAQSIVTRLLWIQDELPFSILKDWSPYHQLLFTCLSTLKKLNIFVGKDNLVSLNRIFRKGLESFFTNPPHNTTNNFIQPNRSLDSFDETFQKILYFVVNPVQSNPHSSSAPKLSKLVIDLLSSSGLLSKNSSANFSITSHGFQFVLLERSNQLWVILSEFVKRFHGDHQKYLHVLALLTKLCFASESMVSVLQGDEVDNEFWNLTAELGLSSRGNSSFGGKHQNTFIHNGMHSWLFVEGLDSSGGCKENGHDRFIIVETNYKLYAYTDSSLQKSILSLFCAIRGAFPNMLFGTLTGDKLKEAFSKGISADQILGYLEKHSLSPSQINTNQSFVKEPTSADSVVSLLPPTISDQIKLWELEKYRLKKQDVVCYNDFATASQFESALVFAENIKGLVLMNKTKKLLIMKPQFHEQMKNFFKVNLK